MTHGGTQKLSLSTTLSNIYNHRFVYQSSLPQSLQNFCRTVKEKMSIQAMMRDQKTANICEDGAPITHTHPSHTHTHTCALGEMAIVMRNGHGCLSSNRGLGCLQFN